MRGASPTSRFLATAAALCLAGYVYVYSAGRAGEPIRSDGFSYYVYLPSSFLFGDLSLAALAADCCGGEFPEFTAIIRWPETGRWVNAHPIGVAVMQFPLFAAAHALTRWSNLSPDGFSLYYQHAVGLSGLLWTIGGLWVLRGLLRRHYSEAVTLAVLAVLLFATSLFHYGTYDSGYSHPYSFFLVAALLDLTERWHRARTVRATLLLGVVAGLLILVRHPNVLLLAFLPLYGLSTDGAAAVWRRLRNGWPSLLLVAAIAALVVAPQLLLYRQATGHLLVSSYGSLGFTFASPHLFGVLLSVQKGVFFWSPMLLVAVAGLAILPRTARAFLAPAVIVLTLDTYLIASWWDWQFGGSYGHRGFVDVYPVLALGLGAAFAWLADRPRLLRWAVPLIALATALSIAQMLQYWNGLLPMSDLTWAQYRGLFLRFR